MLFDLFGTLVHYDASRTNQAYPQTFQFVQDLGLTLGYAAFLAETDRVFAELDAWSIEHQLEFSMLMFAERLFSENGVTPNESTLHQFALLYTTEWSASVTPVPGVQTFLSSCAKKFQTGLITNTHHQPMVESLLEKEGIGPFELVTTSVEHGRPKPHPDIFLDTVSALQLNPEEVIYVGDNYRADFQGASAAGLTCYLVGQHARVPREFQLPTVLDLPIHLLR